MTFTPCRRRQQPVLSTWQPRLEERPLYGRLLKIATCPFASSCCDHLPLELVFGWRLLCGVGWPSTLHALFAILSLLVLLVLFKLIFRWGLPHRGCQLEGSPSVLTPHGVGTKLGAPSIFPYQVNSPSSPTGTSVHLAPRCRLPLCCHVCARLLLHGRFPLFVLYILQLNTLK
jgi:hypothetical protein